MIKKTLLFIGLLCCFGPPAHAQLIEEEPTYDDNTGALSTGGTDAAADITSDSESTVLGTKDGEITLFKTDAEVVVYSGLNRVEHIQDASDGWVGSFQFESDTIKFTPSGRPELNCPAQTLASWFGPCKLQEDSGS